MKENTTVNVTSVVILSPTSSMSTEILHFVTQYSLYTGCITFSLGFIGNLMNILIFTQLKSFRNNRCAFYISVESVSNCIDQCLMISLTILTSIYGDDATGRSNLWCKFRYIVAQSCALTTFYTICFTAVDQFLSTNHRHDLRQICTFQMARCLTIAFICLCIIHSVVFGLFFDIQPSFGCVISNLILIQYSTYFYYSILGGLLPITVASLFAILSYRNVRRIVRRQIPIVRRRLDRQMTALILTRVIVYVSLVLPYDIYRIYIIHSPVSRNKPMEYAIGRLVQAIFFSFFILNYTVSFYVFMISSSRFRRQVKMFIVKKCWRQWISRLIELKHNRIAPGNTNSNDSNMQLEEG